jgi:AcrR family transcriptional regulator
MRVLTKEKRETIVELAVQLFEEKGFEAASMSELARRMGGSKATLYRYFVSKEDVFAAVIQAYATAHLAEASKMVNRAAEERSALRPALDQAGNRVLEVMLNDRRAIVVYRLVMAEAGKTELGSLFHISGPSQFLSALSRFFQGAMERGEMRGADPQISAMQFLSLLTAENGIRLHERNPPSLTSEEIAQRVERAVALFLDGVKLR